VVNSQVEDALGRAFRLTLVYPKRLDRRACDVVAERLLDVEGSAPEESSTGSLG